MLIAIDPQRVPDSFVRTTVTLETDRRLDALQVQVLSRTNLLQLIEEFGLYPQEIEALPQEEVIAKMRESINVVRENARARAGQVPQPAAFRVRFVHTDPALAAKVTQRLGEIFVDQNIRDRGALAGATNRFLETQLADARTKLEVQEQRLEAFRQRHGQELPTQTQSNVQSLSSTQLQAQSLVESIARDRDRKQMLERLYREAASEPPPTPVAVAQAGSAPAVGATAQQQLAAARANLNGLETRYKPDHPDVVRARRQVAELEPKAAAEAQVAATREPNTAAPSGVLTPAELARRERLREMAAEIESLDRQIGFREAEERRVRGEIAEYQRRLEAVPGLESEWVKLTRDYDTMQAAYRELLTKSTAADLAANLEDQDIGERFRIVDPAQVPVRPVQSLRVRYNAGGLLAGLLIGLGLAALLEIRDRSFRTETDVLESLSLPVLATVPYIETAAEKARDRKRRLVVSVIGALCVAVAGYVAWNLKLWNSLL
ncbi:GNVR domain-containing protein [Luteitalea sp.]|uniref:GNVR domain-containing protein n=1 Tax=Luteitalea sp. TaxID=2004800 RepID=UPI0025B90C6E|nr:GNVR domain-containing protein [Luteitalea sp.]